MQQLITLVRMEDILKQELQSNFSTVFPKAYEEIRESYLLEMHGKFDHLREEISKCIVFGLFQASITLTNHLLEVMLKDFLIFNYCGTSNLTSSNVVKFREAINKFDNLDLDDTINRSCTAAIITKDEKKQLKDYKDIYRNAYGHAEKKRLFGNDSIKLANFSFDNSTLIEAFTVEASTFYIMHGEMQKDKAQKEAIPYFLYVDTILCREEIKLHPEVKSRPELYKRQFNFNKS